MVPFVRDERVRPENKATGEEALANRLRSLIAKRYPAPLLAWIPHLRVACDAPEGAMTNGHQTCAVLCSILGYGLRMVGASSE